MTQLSERITQMEESATLAMAAKARELKSSGADVISLSLGEPDFKTPKHICEGAKEAIDTGKYFAYPPVSGYLDLREAIASKFKKDNNLDYTPEEIVVSNGAKQSIANAMLALLDPGDEVVVFAPYWVSYDALIRLAGGVPVYVGGDLSTDFKPSAEQIKKSITAKTKAIIYSSPCNPTGSVFTEDELKSIASVVLEHKNLMVFSDEIYEHIVHEGQHFSIGAIPGMKDRTITVNGFAKGFAMTGWRVGYLGAPLWMAKACAKMQGQLTSANASISQRAALTALTSSLEPTREMAKAYKSRRDMVHALLQEVPGWKINQPAGAFYFFPDVSYWYGKGGINSGNDLCMYLLEKAHVSLVEGAAFGAPDCIRLSYAASESDLKEAIKRIIKALEDLT